MTKYFKRYTEKKILVEYFLPRRSGHYLEAISFYTASYIHMCICRFPQGNLQGRMASATSRHRHRSSRGQCTLLPRGIMAVMLLEPYFKISCTFCMLPVTFSKTPSSYTLRQCWLVFSQTLLTFANTRRQCGIIEGDSWKERVIL